MKKNTLTVTNVCFLNDCKIVMTHTFLFLVFFKDENNYIKERQANDKNVLATMKFVVKYRKKLVNDLYIAHTKYTPI